MLDCVTLLGMSTQTTRKAVALTPEELAALAAARNDGLLDQLVGQDVARSESSALHALIVLGLERVAEQRQVNGYAALADSEDDEDRAYRAAMRNRRRGSEDE